MTEDSRPIINVTQWCKRTACWDGVQAIKYELTYELENCLISNEESKHQKKQANKDQRINKGINAQTEVVKYPVEHWKRLTEFAVEHHLVAPSDVIALKIACQIPIKIPNAVQSRQLLDLESKARAEGFKSED